MRYRWTILGAGVAAQASFSALLIGLASVAPAIQHRYGLSLAQVGVVLAAVNIGLVVTLAHMVRALVLAVETGGSESRIVDVPGIRSARLS